MYAHTQTFLPKDHGRSIVQFPSYLSSKKNIHINSARGGKPRALAHMLDSLVRVSRRVDKRHFVRVSQTHDSTPAHTGQEASPAHSRKPDLPAPRVTQANTTSHRFHFSTFRYFSLSFQSSFHLSLTVLVRYRSPTNI